MLNKETFFETLLKPDPHFAEPVNVLDKDEVIVVLDDDPTGTQTVHDVPVITSHTETALIDAFKSPIFYILTNSRSLNESAAYALILEVVSMVKVVAEASNKRALIITRTDSTLRGHFKAEPDAVAEALGTPNVLRVFAPAFFEGGRYTIGNEHYVEEGQELIKASNTPFAQDKSFGYQSSNLYDYILEKDSTVHKSDIFDFSIEEIRQQNLEYLHNKLADNSHKKYLIVNAADHADLNKIAHALVMFQSKGAKLIIRSAAGIVPALGGIKPKPLLNGSAIKTGNQPGLIVVGSYVPKSTSQLQFLLKNHDLCAIELDVDQLIDAEKENYIQLLKQRINEAMNGTHDCVLYTSRKLVAGNDKNQSLEIVNRVSNSLISLVQSIKTQPSFILAKGGITSSDIATKALEIKKATVLGQIIPGVPVWKTDTLSKYPCMCYVIFPGNVGDEKSLSEVYHKLTQ
ncbi:MAG: hypothetical protein JXR10_07645 [Cyclobacteriaceae bacterium]